MGTMNHNAVVLTTWCSKSCKKLRKWIYSLSKWEQSLWTEVPDEAVNGYRTFLLGPDGSKEGWEESAWGDALRDTLVQHLKTYDYEDGSSPWCWVEVGFGEYGQKMLRGNCNNKINDDDYAEI